MASLQEKNGRFVNNKRNEIFKAFVFFFFSQICSASIISPRAILTAAHCFNPPVPTDVYAVVGINGKHLYLVILNTYRLNHDYSSNYRNY